MPSIIPELRRRASLWFEQHGDPVEAIWQAISGEDWPRVDALIKEHERSLINQGLSRVVLRMYQSIPDDVVRSSPWLLFSRATAYDLNGEVEGSARDLALLEQLVERLEQSPEEADRISEEDRLRLRTSLARTLAFTAVLHNDFESMLRRSDDALQYLPPDEHEIRGLTRGIRAQPQWLVGDLEGAAADFRQAIELSKLADAPIAHLIGLLGLGSIEVEWGQFDRAADHYSQAISFAERHGLATWQYTGRIMSFQSEVPYERNEFEEALAIATRAREIVGIWASRHAFDISYLHLARIHHALGDLERTRSLLRQSPPYGGIGPGNVVVAQIEAYQALVDLEAGERGQLAAIEKELTMPVSEVLDRIWLWTPALRTRAQVLNAIGRFDEAVELLDPLFEICIERGWTRQAVQTGAVLALSYQGLGNQQAALRVFEQALAEAEPRGFLRSILDAGAGITQVMDAVRTRRRDEGRDTAYVDRLLVAARAEVLAQADKPVARDQGLVDRLSEREIEVLQLIAAGHTNAEIADKLYVVVGTVKAHTHNIYSKLGVRSRTQAVMRGRELRLLD
jgi:LuxR family maltose regulon positive regulatory protein